MPSEIVRTPLTENKWWAKHYSLKCLWYYNHSHLHLKFTQWSDTMPLWSEMLHTRSMYHGRKMHQCGTSQRSAEPLLSIFRKLFKKKSNWTPTMQPISAPTLETINTMRNHKVNSMAGKLFLYNDTVYTKHKCKPNLIEQQLKTTRELNHSRDIIELVIIIVV